MTQKTPLSELINYYKAIKDPGYAILITGPWGVGKTHQLLNLLAKEEIYYVSLFGLKNAEEIHSSVFAKMNPIKSKIKKGGETLSDTGIEAYGFSINLGGLAPGLINAFIKEEIRNDKLIIFDDFERCEAPITERLGAINTYIEHNKCNVIVVTNDEKIANKDFSEAKEKLFGHTINIKPNRESAYDYFIDKFKHSPKLKYIQNNKIKILKCMEHADITSLRILRQIISDVMRLYECLDDKHLSNDIALEEVTLLFTALNSLLRNGDIDKKDINNRSHFSTLYYISQNHKIDASEATKRWNAAQEKFKAENINLSNPIISDISLSSMLINGIYDKSQITSEINSSRHFAKPSEVPAWQTFMEFDTKSDEETELAVRKLLVEFDSCSTTNQGELLHLFAFRFLMSSLKIIESDIETTESDCINYIDKIFDRGTLPTIKIGSNPYRDLLDGHAGYGFYVLDSYKNNFDVVRRHLIQKTKEIYELKIQSNKQEILNEMKYSPQDFINKICHNGSGSGEWADVPVLKNIHIQDFYTAFIETPREYWRRIQIAFERRYSTIQLKEHLFVEIEWIESLIKKFEDEAKKLDGIKRYRLERITPVDIRNNIEEFRKTIEEL